MINSYQDQGFFFRGPRVLSIAGLLLVAAIAFLLWINHSSHNELEMVTRESLRTEIANIAATLEYFIYERANDVKVLSESRMISQYFEKRNLGLTKIEDLRERERIIIERFGTICESRSLREKSIYEAIALVDSQGNLIAGSPTSEIKGADGHETGNEWPSGLIQGRQWEWQGRVLSVTADASSFPGKIVLSQPVFVKGELMGHILVRIPLENCLPFFFTKRQTPGIKMLVLTKGRTPLACPIGRLDAKFLDLVPQLAPPGEAGQTPAISPATNRGGDYVLSALGNTGLSVVAFIQPDVIADKVSPWTIPIVLVAFCGTVLLGMAVLGRFKAEGQALKVMLEEKSTAKEAAEAASQAKSAFLANMSHEIRTPMVGVLGLTQLALRNCTDPKIVEYLKLVEESGKNLLHIINDILDLSKIEAGKAELKPQPMSVRDIVESTANSLMVTAREKGLDLSFSVDPAVPDRVIGDSGRLCQILSNLLGNAIKFTRQGTIRVGVALDPVAPAAAGQVRVLFRVKDSGMGIPQEMMDKIFESFAAAVSSAHLKFGGTGLGLAISKELVEMMGGRIWVASKQDKGSTFYFTAEFTPAGSQAGQTDKGPADSPGKSPSWHILIAEDNPVSRFMLEESLRQKGHSVTVVPDGKRALEALGREDFDAVLMDSRMPEIDGEEAVRRVRHGQTRDSEVPIIAVTASALVGDRERLLAAGMDDYLPKPFNMDILDQILRKVITERHARGTFPA